MQASCRREALTTRPDQLRGVGSRALPAGSSRQRHEQHSSTVGAASGRPSVLYYIDLFQLCAARVGQPARFSESYGAEPEAAVPRNAEGPAPDAARAEQRAVFY